MGKITQLRTSFSELVIFFLPPYLIGSRWCVVDGADDLDRLLPHHLPRGTHLRRILDILDILYILYHNIRLEIYQINEVK